MNTYMELLGSDTNQFWGENNQFVVPIQPEFVEEMSIEETPPDNKGKKRTQNFTKEEDELLLSAWLEISMDGTQGNEQSSGTYWKRIHNYLHKHKTFNLERSPVSLTSRWQTILESVNRFCGCYTQIQNKRQSGITKNDMIVQACALYKERDGKKSHLFCYIAGIYYNMSKNGW